MANEFEQSKQVQWQAFLRTGGVVDAPQDFTVVPDEVRRFLLPVSQTVSVLRARSVDKS